MKLYVYKLKDTIRNWFVMNRFLSFISKTIKINCVLFDNSYKETCLGRWVSFFLCTFESPLNSYIWERLIYLCILVFLSLYKSFNLSVVYKVY